MNYAIARVSDPEQRKALPAQRKKLFDYAELKTWKENKDFVYIEYDETAFKENRKDFRELVIEPLKRETALAIVVFDKIDRFSRDATSDERKVLTDLFRKGRIELHFPSDNLFIHQYSPAADLFRLDIGVALAGYYSASIRDNVKRRFDQMLADGIWVGKAPIGYMNTGAKDKTGKEVRTIQVDEERSQLIHKAFELRATGLSLGEITIKMAKAGLVGNTKNLKPITKSQWENIFNDTFYIGAMRYMGRTYPHIYKTFIEPWLWDKVQDVKNSRSKSRTKYNSKPFLFKELKCHTCGYAITFDGPKKNGMTYGHCTEYGGKHGAEGINESILYDQFREVLKAIELPKDKLSILVKEIERGHTSEQQIYTEAKKKFQKEYDALDKELEDLFKDRKQFASRHELFERMVNKIEKRQRDLLDSLQDNSDGDKAFVIGASYLLDVCSRAVELFDAKTTTIEQKRYLVSFLLSNMTLEGKTLRFTLLEPFDAIINMNKSSNWLTTIEEVITICRQPI